MRFMRFMRFIKHIRKPRKRRSVTMQSQTSEFDASRKISAYESYKRDKLIEDETAEKGSVRENEYTILS